MKAPDKNKQKILILLLAVLALSVIYRVTHPFKQERVDVLTFDKKNHFKRIYDNSDSNDRGNSTGIMLNFIDSPPNHSGRVKNNIFSPNTSIFGQGDKTVTETNRKDTPPTGGKETGENRIDGFRNAGAGFSNFKIFGMYENEQDKVIFLERGKDILALREGDTIDGTFRVQKISDKMVTIKSEHSDRPLVINMNGLENN